MTGRDSSKAERPVKAVDVLRQIQEDPKIPLQGRQAIRLGIDWTTPKSTAA